MFRFAENSRCRENEIPAFAGMEVGGKGGEIKSIPILAFVGMGAREGEKNIPTIMSGMGGKGDE